ncbi:MAG: DUF2851 family protein [Chloroflexi bacterium]|nr:DUF2851 family protein [Chloroflexota bacterium]
MPAPLRQLAPAASEAALAERWAAGCRGPLRLEDGRTLKVVFPGVPSGSAGPDFTGAILDAGGDLLRGDVELHLVASGWRAHGHHVDPAYAGVVLHAVASNDESTVCTLHRSGRSIPILVLPPAAQGQPSFPPPFTPPCALEAARGRASRAPLERLGLRRLRTKAAAALPLVAAAGPGQALYALTLEIAAGPSNRAAFSALARRIPLAAILERAAGSPVSRRVAMAAELRGAAAQLAVRRAGSRPMASPARRLESAAALFAAWWPEGALPAWPSSLRLEMPPPRLLPASVGRTLAIETWVNAVLPVALASGAWPDQACESALLGLPSPGTYGKLKPLAGWLGSGGARPFSSSATLQGGLLLHADYRTKGHCGRCPLSG